MSFNPSWDSREEVTSVGHANPAPAYARPLHVVHDDTLDVDAKRHILECWNPADENVSHEEVRFALNTLERMYCAIA